MNGSNFWSLGASRDSAGTCPRSRCRLPLTRLNASCYPKRLGDLGAQASFPVSVPHSSSLKRGFLQCADMRVCDRVLARPQDISTSLSPSTRFKQPSSCPRVSVRSPLFPAFGWHVRIFRQRATSTLLDCIQLYRAGQHSLNRSYFRNVHVSMCFRAIPRSFPWHSSVRSSSFPIGELGP